MGRLISLLVVVAIMALMWVAMADGIAPTDDCVDTGSTSLSIPKGLEGIVNECP